MCVKKFIFSKFAGLQAYSHQLYYQMNSFTGFFDSILSPPAMLPQCIDLSTPLVKYWRAPPMFSTPVGNPALYSCLNVEELLAWSRCEIGSLSDCNWSRTQNHLVCKQTLNHHSGLKWFWVWVQFQLLVYFLFKNWNIFRLLRKATLLFPINPPLKIKN